MKTIITIICGVLYLAPCLASAQDFRRLSTEGLYLSAFLDRQSLDGLGGDPDLHPGVLSGAVGYWVAKGISLELEGGFGIVDDEIGSLDLDTGSTLALNLRLESPPAERYALYTLFGYVRTTFDATDNGVESSLSFPGLRFALGITYRLTPLIVLDLAATHQNYEDDARINSFRFGVRFDRGLDN